MPQRPAKACRVSGCKQLVRDRKYQGFCEQHKDKAGWFANEKLKGNRHKRGYNSEWDRIRPLVLKRDNHLCQQCKASGRFVRATHVDHIKAKNHGGTNAMTNLQSLCSACHGIKTAAERLSR